MAYKHCPRCRALIPAGAGYCETCKPLAEAEALAAMERRYEHKRKKYNREYNQRRDPKRLAFYRSKEWRATSKAKLSDAGYRCEARLEGCTGLAVEVHHVQPLRTPEGWARRLEWDGLQAVCINCHNILDGKTFKRREDPGVIDLRAFRGGND